MPGFSMGTWSRCTAPPKCAAARSWSRGSNEVTVKRYRQEGSIVWLLPENSDFQPIKVDLKEEPLLIEGIVVGVVRRGR